MYLELVNSLLYSVVTSLKISQMRRPTQVIPSILSMKISASNIVFQIHHQASKMPHQCFNAELST